MWTQAPVTDRHYTHPHHHQPQHHRITFQKVGKLLKCEVSMMRHNGGNPRDKIPTAPQRGCPRREQAYLHDLRHIISFAYAKKSWLRSTALSRVCLILIICKHLWAQQLSHACNQGTGIHATGPCWIQHGWHEGMWQAPWLGLSMSQ